MNHIYKVIWNTITQTWVAVSELSRAKGKTKSSKTLSAVVLAAVSAGAIIGDAEAATNFVQNQTGIAITRSGGDAPATASDRWAIAVGDSAKANSEYSIAVGGHTNATGESAIAIGKQTKAEGQGATAVGRVTLASAQYSSAYGAQAKATGDQSTALGYVANAGASNSLAAGALAQAQGESSVALGRDAQAWGSGASAVGEGSRANNSNAFAGGNGAQATGSWATAVGPSTLASGEASAAYGDSSEATGKKSIATGSHASASAENAIAIGNSTKAQANNTIAIGNGTKATDKSENSLVIGQGAVVTAKDATVVGPVAQANGENATAVGRGAAANGTESTALGRGSVATGNQSIALGKGANAKVDSGVALGDDSVADRTARSQNGIVINTSNPSKSTGFNTENSVYAPVRLVDDPEALNLIKNTIKGNKGAVSVGDSGNTRQIINVAAGSADSDAVNVAQLKAVVGTIKHYNVTSKDGDITIDPDTTDPNKTVWDLKINPKYKIKYFSVKSEGGANQNNDGATATDAIAIGKNASSTGSSAVSLGLGAKALGANNTAIGAGAQAKDVRTTAIGYNATAEAASAVGIGYESKASHSRSLAIGQDATASANNAIALGSSGQHSENKTTASAEHAVAIGSGAVANIANGIALGSQSKTTAASGQTGFDASQDADGARVNKYANLTNNNQNVRTSTLAGLSIGDTAKTRQINHLAAGTADDDAVNVAQLKSVNLAFKGNGGSGDVRLHDQRLSVVGAENSFITTTASDKKLEISTTQGTFSTTDGKSSSTTPGLATTTTVANAINESGWEVQAKGTKVGLVNPGDKVNFTNADKSIEIQSDIEASGLSTIKFKAVTETIQTEEKSPITQIDVNGSTVSKTTKGKNEPTGRFVVPTGDKANKYALATAYDVADKVNQTGWNLYTNGGARSLINPGDYVNFKSGNATNATVVTEASEGATISYDVNVDNTTIKINPENKLTANTVDLTVNKTGDKAGTVGTPEDADKGKLVTAENVVKAVNESYWVAKKGDRVETNADTTSADTNVTAGSNVTFVAGKNIALQKDGNKFIYATKDDVTFTDVTTTNTTTTNLTVKSGGNVDMGNNKVKNVADGKLTSDSKEAVNGSQLYAVDNKFNNTVTLGGENNSVTDAQKLNKDGGLRFNIVGAENGNITTTASGTDVKIDLTQGTKNDIKQGVDANTTVTTKGLTFVANTGNTGAKKLGSSVDIKGNTSNNVITTTANESGITVDYNGTEAAKVTNLTYKANGKNDQTVSLATGLNFKDGQGTTVTVGANGEVTYNATVAGLTAGNNVKITEDGKGNFTIAATDTNTQSTVSNATGSAITVTPTNNTDGTKNYELDVAVDDTTIKKENGVLKAVIPAVKTVTLTTNAGKVGDVSTDDANKFVTGDNLAKTINATYWKVSQGAHEESTSEETEGVASSEIKPGDELTFASGKNMALKKVGSKFIYATKDDVTFTDVTTTNTTTTNLTVKSGGNVDMGNNKVKNVADGKLTSDSKEAVNGSQLYQVMTNATAGWNLSVNNGNDKGNVKPGAQVDLNNSDGNIIISKNANNVTFNFNPNATFGVKGEQGKDGIDGSIGVNGKDGSAVAINGKDGSIGLNGKDGKNGLTIKGQGGKVGVDGKDGETRLVYVEKADPTKPGSSDKTHELATLEDGMKYGGDIGEVANVKLNKQVDVKGGVTDKTKLSDNNIGVVSTPNATTGGTELTVKLAKELKGLTSAEFKDGDNSAVTNITNSGITIKPANSNDDSKTVSLTNTGLNNGGNKIINVAEGENDTDAVNVKQLKDFKSEVAEGGLTFAGNSGTAHKAKLNTTVNIKGGKDNTDATQFDNGKNVMTAVNGDTVTVSIKKTPEVEGINIIDKDGKVKVKLTQTNEGLKVSDGNDNATRITNVKAGEKDTDAVNVKQLKAAKTKVEAGENIEITSSTDQTNGQTIYKVSAKGINDTSAAVKAGSNHVEVTKAANTHKDGSTTVTDYTVDLSKETKDDIKKGVDAHTKVTTEGLTFNADKGTTTGVKKLGSSVAVNGDGKNITTTADKNGVTVSMKDKINVKAVTAEEVNVGDVNINKNGINAGGKRITNVAPGKDGTDAVNVNQLKYVAGNISNQINNVDKGLRAGIAGALASGGLYHVTTAGKSMVSVGAGTYRGQNALAVGYSRLSDNGKVGVKFTVNSNSQGHAGASASVGYQW